MVSLCLLAFDGPSPIFLETGWTWAPFSETIWTCVDLRPLVLKMMDLRPSFRKRLDLRPYAHCCPVPTITDNLKPF